MKKYFAIMVAVLFLFGVAGAGLAQQAAPSGKQDVPAKPIDGKKTEKSEKRQAVTPEKKKAAEAPAVTDKGMDKTDTKPVKKSEKSKKRQAQTPAKKKAAEAPATGEGMAAPPAPAKK